MKRFAMITFFRPTVAALLVGLNLGLLAATGFAQQQFRGVCSTVKIAIQQELTLERIGFEGKLEVTNNDGQDPITDFFADLTFENPELSTNGSPHDASGLFFVRTPEFESINNVSGTGVIQPTHKAVVRWFIIPKIAAGGTSPNGIRYRVGCRLAGKIRGVEIPREVLFAIPDTITVRPEPQLDITYFQPRDVTADDPFTEEVESPIPFSIGVLVKNAGYGPARQLKIDSQQPKIIENKNGLLLIARLLGARVQDSPLQTASLLVDLGDIMPGQARKGAWDMITSLSGEFIDFRASYKHASDLGGEETSVIKSLEAHFIAREVLNDQPGRDPIRDFLADVDRDENLLPDTLFESEGNRHAVQHGASATVVGSAGPGGTFQVDFRPDIAGWNYLRLDDPGQGRLRIASATRSDGKSLSLHNVWTHTRYRKPDNVRFDYLNLFDAVDLKNYTYTITYAAGTAETNPPVTTLRFVGPATSIGSQHYITRDTQVYFTSEDENPVSIFYSITNSPFLPAYPFSLLTPGEYALRFYGRDSFSNYEPTNSATLIVSGEATLGFDSVAFPEQPLFVPGDALSVRPAQAPLSFRARSNPARTDARLDVFPGVIAWPTVGNVPSSPTPTTTAALGVAGEFVDYYKYQLNGGAWSAEQSVTAPITLSGLNGNVTVAVLGRSRLGTYPPDTNAIVVRWQVDAAAPATRITGTPATPSRQRLASFAISGSSVSDYRWTLNWGYYRAETPVSNPLLLTNLTAGDQVLSVIGKISGSWQLTNDATTVAWTTDPLYGYRLESLATKVRSATFPNIGTTLQTFAWDGRSQTGTILPPGPYTLRLTLYDDLGRTNFTTAIVQIGDLAGEPAILADVIRGPKNPHARAQTIVWQDQSDGNWEIYARSLIESNSPVIKLTDGILNQENPRTDGRYVVWQARQTNGNWDVLVRDVAGNTPALNLTATAAREEINPTIEWPWIVYQSRSSSDPNAPWLLRAYHMVSGQTTPVASGPEDQLDPDLQGGRVVWQDYRDVGPGEIYLKNLETGELRRLTTNTFGQFHPALSDLWVVWQDTRHGQLELYGFDLLRNTEFRLTTTPENESRPYLDGPWAVCEEDSLGVLSSNLRLVHLPSRNLIPLTRSTPFKARPAIVSGKAIWQQTEKNLSRIMVAEVPSLQAVFNNQNAVAVTEAMTMYLQNAHTLLRQWQAQAGVAAITRYSSLVPTVVSETVRWTNGAPSGPNFTLTPGTFLWIRFNEAEVLDLGMNPAPPITLGAGSHVFSYTGFPSQYSAYRFLRQLGLTNVRAVRMLDAEGGNWVMARVDSGAVYGQDFPIPRVAVLMLELANGITNFKPQ